MEGGDELLFEGLRVGSKQDRGLVLERNAKGFAGLNSRAGKCFLNQCLKPFPRTAAVAKSNLHAASVCEK